MRSFHLPGRSTVHGIHGMAAASSQPATLAAVDVLRGGGNAVDAAVTASAVSCVTEPHMTGIGGDCFALIGRPDGAVVGLNGSGRAAMAADAAWLAHAKLDRIAPDSVHSVTVPGAIDAWDRLLSRYGTMTLKEALEPAIRLAEEGSPVAPRVAHDWARLVDKLAKDEGGRQHLLPGGRAPRAGERMRHPALAATLRIIAALGRDAFYAGAIADDIVQHLRRRGGLLTLEDFARTRADDVEPVGTLFRGREVLEMPPNGQGITALIALNVLSRLDLDRHGPDSALRYHLQVEAVRLAYALRNRHVADPAFHRVPVEELLSVRTAERLARLIDPGKALPDAARSAPPLDSDTVYLCVVDKDRLAASFINSTFSGFGSGIVMPRTGIVLHNRGAGFVTDKEHPNCIAPGKRPLHTIIPAMVREEGRVTMPFGVMGGAFQAMGHVHLAANMFVYGMDIQEAIDFPRVFHEAGSPAERAAPGGAYHGRLGVEAGVAERALQGLAALGHAIDRLSEPLGGGQGIVIDRANDALIGGSDPRKDGCALGY